MGTSGDCQFKTLSGFEAADEHNSWDTFKHLIADEEFHLDSSSNRAAMYETSDHVTLMVCVEDTGIGIPLHVQDCTFMPFMQADSSTSRNYGGTGIGLSISKCLVERMGGQISFVSRPQIGSTFFFTAVFERCKKNAFKEVKKPISEDLPSGFKGLKAILVDGKPVRAAVTRYHLKRLGIHVELASIIKKGVALFVRNGSSISGFEATQRIRLMESEANKQMNGESTVEEAARKGEWHTPILTMTADVIHATYEECLKCGMDGYVSKPFQEENLYQAVAKIF